VFLPQTSYAQVVVPGERHVFSGLWQGLDGGP
jgi:hypothetical protein